MYIGGDWAEAKGKFEEFLKVKPGDGPTSTLLNYLKARNYKKPEGWDGFRKLTSK